MSLTSVRAYRSLTLATCLICLVATLLHIIAYSTPYWLESDGNSPFINLGWHQACFDHCHHPYCPGGDPDIVFDGCYIWAFNDRLRNDYNFQEMVHWLFPRWFDTAFNILTVNIVLLVICCCLMLVCTCFAFAARYKPEAPVKKDIAALVLLYISLFVLILSSLMNVAGVAIFTSNGPSRDYMPLADRNSFGFSYWLDLFVCILLGLSSFTVFLAAIAKTIHFQGPRDARYSEDMMLGRI